MKNFVALLEHNATTHHIVVDGKRVDRPEEIADYETVARVIAKYRKS